MFENLTERLNTIFAGLTRRGKLSEEDVNAAMREVRLALLEADVHYSVVKTFVASVRERAVGVEEDLMWVMVRSFGPADPVDALVGGTFGSTLCMLSSVKTVRSVS